MSTTTVLTTEKPRQWLARRRDDVSQLLGGGKRADGERLAPQYQSRADAEREQ